MKKSQLSIVVDAQRVDTVDILARHHELSRSAMIDNLIWRGLRHLTAAERTALDKARIERGEA